MHNNIILTILLCASAAYAADYKGLGAESVPPATIAKYAPPPLPPEISRRTQTLLDVRSPGMGMVSPDGKQLFFNWGVTGNSQIWRLDSPNSFPLQMTGGEDATALQDISYDGKMLIVSRDRGGEENPGLYWQSSAGGPLHEIQHQAKVRTSYAFMSNDSQRIYFRANDIAPDSYALYRYDLKTGAKKLLFSEPGIWSIADRRGETEFLLVKSIGNMWQEYYLWTPADKKFVPLLGQGEKEDYGVIFAAVPGEYLVVTPKFSEFRRVYLFRGGKFTPLSPEMKWNAEAVHMDEARRRIYYSINEAGYARVVTLDAKTYKPLALPKFKNAEFVLAGTPSPDGRYVALGVENARLPLTTYIYDWKTSTAIRWVMPSTPEVDVMNFTRPMLQTYPAEDGTPIPMFVWRPKACENPGCPVIVSFHGGPESQARPYFSARREIFLEQGFIWVEPNVRGSSGYGKSWIGADDGAKRLDVISDIRACATYIKKVWAKDGVAPKVGVTGGSYGGYSTQVAMTMFAGSFDAGYSVVGMSNLVTFLNNTAPYRRLLRVSEYGDVEKDLEALKKLSPLTYIDQVKAPMFFVQGLNDPRVPVGEALQMHETLVKKGIPSQLVIFPDEGHGAAKRDNVAQQLGQSLAFFQKYLR